MGKAKKINKEKNKEDIQKEEINILKKETSNKNTPKSNNSKDKKSKGFSKKKIFLIGLLSLTVLGVAYSLATSDSEKVIACSLVKGATLGAGVLRIITGLIIMFSGFLQITLGTFFTLLAVVLSLGLGVIVSTVHTIFGSLFDLSPILDKLQSLVQTVASQQGQDGFIRTLFSLPVDPMVALTERLEAFAAAVEGC